MALSAFSGTEAPLPACNPERRSSSLFFFFDLSSAGASESWGQRGKVRKSGGCWWWHQLQPQQWLTLRFAKPSLSNADSSLEELFPFSLSGAAASGPGRLQQYSYLLELGLCLSAIFNIEELSK